MDRALRSVAASTFGFSSSRSNGKGKSSKSTKASRDLIEKEKLIIKKEEEPVQVNQQSSLNDSDGQSYGTSEEENEIECSQQQSGQGVSIGMVGEGCYIEQANNCDQQACIAIQEDDALSGDENCQQQCGQETLKNGWCDVVDSPIGQDEADFQQTSTNIETFGQNIQSKTDACYSNIQIKTIDEIEKEIIPTQNKHDSITVCTQSEQSNKCVNEVVETCTTQVKCVDVTEVVCKSTDVCKSQKTETKMISQQSHQDLSSNGTVQACYAAQDVEVKTIACGIKNNDTKDIILNGVVGICGNDLSCGVGPQVCPVENICLDAIQEINNSTCKTIETQQDNCIKSIITKTTENIHTTQTNCFNNVQMTVVATSKNSCTNKIEEDTEVLITATFVNPLSTSLTNGKFWIEADNLVTPYCFEIPEIDAGETVICRALIYPQCAGYEFIVARFTSCEIKRIVGFTNIRISRAITCESSTKKVVTCTKM